MIWFWANCYFYSSWTWRKACSYFFLCSFRLMFRDSLWPFKFWDSWCIRTTIIKSVSAMFYVGFNVPSPRKLIACPSTKWWLEAESRFLLKWSLLARHIFMQTLKLSPLNYPSRWAQKTVIKYGELFSIYRGFNSPQCNPIDKAIY